MNTLKKNRKLAKAASVLRKYRNNILLYVDEQFKISLDKWQEKGLKEFADPNKKISRISLNACAGPGKSACLAFGGLWFLCTQGEKNSHPKGAVVSETIDNLKDGLWSELAVWLHQSKLCKSILKWTKTRVHSLDHPETWFLSARTFNKDANANDQGRTLSGLHSKYNIFLIDEAGKIPITVLKAAEQSLSVADKVFARIMIAGNPTTTDGLLYHAGIMENWLVINITGDPDDPERSTRIDEEWARLKIKQYGRSDPWIQAYVLGIFPEGNINTLLSLKEVEDAMKRVPPPNYKSIASKRLGIDTARFGMDSNVIFPRQGLVAYNFVEMRNVRGNELAARVALGKEKWGSHLEFVDDTGGFGGSLLDSLIQYGLSPHGIHFAGKASSSRYFNRRSEMYFRLAEWVKRGGILPQSQRLKKELVSQTYFFKNGKFALEEKDQIVKRLGFSPDISDALSLTFAIPESPAPTEYPPGFKKEKNWDYDPTAD